MALPESYLVSVANLARILASLQTAGVPPRVTVEFLKTLGFKSSGDRNVISVLKSLGFLDANGTPTEIYRRYRSQTDARRVLAEAIRSAYSDVFLANENAQDISVDKVKDVIATKTGKSERVVQEMARTFKALCLLADFSDKATLENDPIEDQDEAAPPTAEALPAIASTKGGGSAQKITVPPLRQHPSLPAFGYNLQIILPTTTDVTVYNAIFQSLRDHIL